MDGGSFFLVRLDLAAHVAVINLELPLQLLAAALFVEVAVLSFQSFPLRNR